MQRLLGQETEYAIRIAPGPRPLTRRAAFDLIAAAVRGAVRSADGRVQGALHSFFVQNGGNFSYEALPWALDAGLFEGATPECRGPTQLLVYQRAQEQILLQALERANREMATGSEQAPRLGLLKNCRDAWDNTYGAQENYEVDAARGVYLWLYRLGLVLLLPVSLAFTLLSLIYLVFAATVALAALPLIVFAVIVAQFHEPWSQAMERAFEGETLSARFVWWLSLPLYHLSVAIGSLYAQLSAACLFRDMHRGLTAFLFSRVIFTGAGSLEDSGQLVLAEKVGSIKRLVRGWATPAAHAVYDTGNLLKRFMGTVSWWPAYRQLFLRRQRMQLGLADSNRAQVAEFLRWGTTCLVIDCIEAGLLREAPRYKSPLQAMRRINSDLTLQQPIELVAGCSLGNEASALQVQRWYLEQVQTALAAQDTVSLEAREVMHLWERVLTTLESEPDALVGQLDWPSKRWMLRAAQADSPEFSALKKIDLKYHELGCGYFDELQRSGLAPSLVSEKEIAQACVTPPADTPAQLRGELIRSLVDPARAVVSWQEVREGKRLRRKVVRLDDYRRPPN